MDGPQVRRAQRALLHNAYGTFDPGPLDGVYGERTAAAVRRAKYWMGFPEQKIDQVCGSDLLDAPRRGVAALVVAQVDADAAAEARRGRPALGGRLRRGRLVRRRPGGAAGQPPVRLHRLVRRARAVVRDVRVVVLRPGRVGGVRARPPLLVRPPPPGDAQRGANHLSITRTPLNADLAIFDLDGDGVPDHIGLFDRWLDADETRYQTVEGNVSLSGEPNGGRVLQRERHRGRRRSPSCTCAVNGAGRVRPRRGGKYVAGRARLAEPARRPQVVAGGEPDPDDRDLPAEEHVRPPPRELARPPARPGGARSAARGRRRPRRSARRRDDRSPSRGRRRSGAGRRRPPRPPSP